MPSPPPGTHRPEPGREPIAIVGMGCRFPGGANGPAGLWRLLREGGDAIVEVPPDRWDREAYHDPDPAAPGKMCTRHGGFLERVDEFDPQFFGIAPREALALDPQQRLVLEVAWEALEDAGLAPHRLEGSRTGVFVGVGGYDYAHECLGADPLRLNVYGATGTSHAVAAGRLSYFLGLHGPSLALDTACSSSLVAVHLACESLRGGGCTLALAGGVNLILSPEISVCLSQGGMLAPDGRCKAFDAAADGYVRGEGCGVVVLRRLADALAAGDRVLAVIRGTAVNQDGRSSGLTVPNRLAQEALLREALADAGVEAARVQYVEAHGTGTPVGDPIEVQALAAVLGEGRPADKPLLVGSVKTNIGHLEIAAGIAGLLKAVLALRHGEIPAHLHLKRLTPQVEWQRLPVAVPTRPTPWPAGGERRLAGVSAFGFSGTNAHVILEEAPPAAPGPAGAERPLHLLTLSARSGPALQELAARYARHLAANPAQPVGDVCFTGNTGRSPFAHRLAVIGETGDHLRRGLTAFAEGRPDAGVHTGRVDRSGAPRVAFLFTGQGSQYVGMGRQLYETQPTFRQALERCAGVLGPLLEKPLLEVLYPGPGAAAESGALLDQTAYAQPALFALEWALAELWRSWGVEPALVMGHSLGEYPAACLAGVFSLEDGLKLIVERARLVQALPAGGTMAAVFADEDQVARAVAAHAGTVALAALNGPGNTVISGARGDVENVLQQLKREGVRAQLLPVSHAFHSPCLDPALEAYARVGARITYAAPRRGLVSNVTGNLADGDVATAAYWCRHLRLPVQFQAAVQTLHREGVRVFLEVGPRPVLLALARRILPEGTGVWLPTLRPGRGDWQQVLESLAALHVHGVPVDWSAFDRDYPRRKVELPTYPFQRQRYWMARAAKGKPEDTPPAGEGWPGWVHDLRWRLQPGPAPDGPADSPPSPGRGPRRKAGRWLILADDGGRYRDLADAIRASGSECVLVAKGEAYDAPAEGPITLRPDRAEDYRRLIGAVLAGDADGCRGVVHLWALDETLGEGGGPDEVRASQERLCGGLLHLVQALAAAGASAVPPLTLVTAGCQPLPENRAALRLLQAPLWGLGGVVAQEHPEFRCVRVDLDPSAGAEAMRTLWREVLLAGREEDQVAFRAGRRYVLRLARREPPPRNPARQPLAFRADASYLITGGLGGLGLVLGRWLAGRGAGHVVLAGRRAPSEPARQAIRAMEEAGARVRAVQVDVADRDRLAEALAQVRDSAAPLRGVIHAAGVLDDGPLLQQDLGRFRKVLAPKVDGAWNLHCLTRDLELDFFVLFSSVATLWGSAGQGSYAAGNAFLDVLAHARRAAGLPGLSINWGPWAEVGMAAALDRRHRDRWTSYGLGEIAPEQGVAALELVLKEWAPQVAVLPVDWPTVFRQYPAGGAPRFLADLAPPAGAPGLDFPPPEDPGTTLSQRPPEGCGKQDLEWRRDFRGAPPERRRGMLQERVLREAAKTLGFDTALIDPGQPLRELGLDSLMALHLRSSLSRLTGTTLPATLALEYPTVEAISEYLLTRVPDRDSEQGPETLPAPPDASGVNDPAQAQHALQSLAQLSDAQVDAMLDALLTKKGAER